MQMMERNAILQEFLRGSLEPETTQPKHQVRDPAVSFGSKHPKAVDRTALSRPIRNGKGISVSAFEFKTKSDKKK